MRDRTYSETGNKIPPGLNVAGLIGAIGSAASSGISAGLSLKSVREQMQFQERMSNTSYQRQMADMRKAGINPMLVAKMGGASTPPGASARIDIDNPAEAAFSARESKRRGDTEKNRKDLIRRQADAVTAQINLMEDQSFSAQSSAQEIQARTRLLNLDLIPKQLEAALAQNGLDAHSAASAALKDATTPTTKKFGPNEIGLTPGAGALWDKATNYFNWTDKNKPPSKPKKTNPRGNRQPGTAKRRPSGHRRR